MTTRSRAQMGVVAGAEGGAEAAARRAEAVGEAEGDVAAAEDRIDTDEERNRRR